MRLSAAWARNPVMRAELKHQRHVIETNRAGRVWIALAVLLVVPGIIISVVYFGAALLLPFMPSARALFVDGGPLAVLFIVNASLYPVVTLITLSLASASIERERDGLTWDSLLLTAVEPRHIVLGKWWASTRMLLGDHVMVAVARLGVIAWIVLLLDDWAGLPPGPFDLPPEVVLLPLLAAINSVYTALDLAFTTALGVLAGLLSRGGMITSTLVLAARLAVMGGGLYLWGLTSLLLIEHPGGLYLALTAVGFAAYGLLIWGTLALARTAIAHYARLG